jgi:hypothetical protein
MIVDRLETDIKAFIEAPYQISNSFISTKSADDILNAVKCFCLKIQPQNLQAIDVD